MTCGQWGEAGHETHVCIDCTELFKKCEIECRRSCIFKLITPERKKLRNEIFSPVKVRV